MIKLLLPLLAIFILSCKDKPKETAMANSDPQEAIYYLIRHSDKERGPNAGDDPALTEIGEARAKFWADELKDVDFDAVYSTNFKRTKSTALPTANQNDLQIKLYDPTNLYNTEFQQETAGKTVLIVGHSNTTPAFVNAIVGENKYDEIDDSKYGYLYVVKVDNGNTEVEIKDFNSWSQE
ncbi:broad specificity phosphatase PhoE [Leeuwenhoekiella aestuarii]|uniref:Broad specificity phosphatase PhoE n=1 Tax=Leeuwenhoekiella aestuarii TaxID=2249426 RepID=A0A4Q0NP97_9FLAO|nr:phosphoglycerate mutase family protein [Leeuwenhoekiella aestuarii]RXG11970.1 broad specificity phosphatase PhoE [Leeuwenhoekiella aestuarii]RXG13528.1 broad specificity phosphatase PhoE [Leeuwenhoekiella aestuarii]